MQILIAFCAVIICLICVIGIHELGHFFAAKCFGVKTNKISLGFGKVLFSWQSKAGYKIDFCILPIGGRVNLLNNRVMPCSIKDYPYCFDKKPIWVRAIILMSGSVANFLLAFLALVLMLMISVKQHNVIIEQVIPNSNAAIAGLRSGDTITKISGHKIYFWRDVGQQIIMHLGQKKVPITMCSVDKVCHDSFINLDVWNKNNSDFSIFSVIGIKPLMNESAVTFVKGLAFLQAVYSAGVYFWELMIFFGVMIKQILVGNIPFAALLGPFKFFAAIIDSLRQGFSIFLYFIGSFSLAMGIANLLPIPTLDGGYILYGFLEKIRGKPLTVAMELLIYRLVTIAFFVFFVQLIVNDLHYYSN